jgi:hypothetical protein
MCVGILFVLAGAFILASIGLRWGWIMNHYKVKTVFRMLGNTWATIFYVMLGMGCVIIGVLIMVGVITLE